MRNSFGLLQAKLQGCWGNPEDGKQVKAGWPLHCSCPQRCHNSLRHVDRLRGMVYSSTEISMHLSQSATMDCINDGKNGLPTQKVPNKEKKSLNSAIGVYYKMAIVGSLWGEEQKVGREAETLGALATTLLLSQRNHLCCCGCSSFVQLLETQQNKHMISCCDFWAVRMAQGLYIIAWQHNWTFAQAVHAKIYYHLELQL